MGVVNKLKEKLKQLIKKNKTNQNLFFTKDHFAGKKFVIGDYTYGHPKILFENENANLTIGKFCSIAEGVTIFLGGNHRTDWITTYPFNDLPKYFPKAKKIQGHPATKGNVIIGNDVWIGRNVTILSGVSIADGSVVGTESVVTKNIGPYEIWGGNPAKLIKKRFDEKTIVYLLEKEWWNLDFKTITENIELLCSKDINDFKIKNDNIQKT